MNLKYHELPFGAQLLLWTSRLVFHGSCRTKPNKYDLVDIAYKKVGIHDGGCATLPVNFDFFVIVIRFCQATLTSIVEGDHSDTLKNEVQKRFGHFRQP